MRSSLAYFLCVSPLLAQSVRPEPRQAPIDALLQSYQSAYNSGRYDEAAMKREQARSLLTQIPANDPQFANWAERISGIYENGGFGAQARDVLEQALARTASLGDQSAARVVLLTGLANAWRQDRNLLQALSFTEQAVAAAETQAPRTAQKPASVSPVFSAALSASPWFSASPGLAPAARVFMYRGSFGADNGGLYQSLFNLYKELGRPQDATALLTRIATHVKNSDGLLASLYQQQGQTDEAAAIYKRQADQAADPQQAAVALQQMANLYQSTQHYGDAASAMQEAIGKIEASGEPDAIQRAEGMRQTLANMLQQAGQVQAADEVYRGLMAGQTNQVGIVSSYAMFLTQTNRADQAETLLKDYQANHPSSPAWEQNNLMMAFANVEQSSGKPELAQEYRRQASAGQPQPPADNGELRVVPALQKAQQLVYAGKPDEAFNLALQALDAAPGAVDRESAAQMTTFVAGSLAAKAPAKANELYRRARGLAESLSPVTATPLVGVLQSYAASLLSQRRWSDFDKAVEDYDTALSASRGGGTGWAEDALRLRTGLISPPERLHGALAASQELVKLEESLSGATSEPYLRAIETLAIAMEASGDRSGTLPLRRKTVTISDLVYPASDMRRATARMNAAMAFAHERQFDEAESLAREAVAIGQHTQPPQPDSFTSQLRQILQLRQAAQATPTPKQ